MSYSYYDDDNKFEFEKDIDVDLNTDIDVNVEVNLKVNKDIDVDIDVDADVEGNTAILIGDFEAIGKDTFVEVTTSAMAIEDKYSGVSVIAEVAVG